MNVHAGLPEIVGEPGPLPFDAETTTVKRSSRPAVCAVVTMPVIAGVEVLVHWQRAIHAEPRTTETRHDV